MTLNSPITNVKGVGSELAKKIAILQIKTVEDLVYYFPRRYDDYSELQDIQRIKPGVVTIKATIKQAKGHYVRRGMHITEAVASDETGSLRLVWFNQPYRAASLNVDQEYFISGEFGLHYQRLSIQNPSIELVSSFPVNTARIVPIYGETKGLKSHQVRRIIRELIPLIQKMPETLPKWLIEQEKLLPHARAVQTMHFPSQADELLKAKRRLGFEEVFELTLAALLNKHELLKDHSFKIPFKEKLAKSFVKQLPFKLTNAQRKVVWQIYLDMQKEQPMNRLVEGDVGSGKTVVATMAALMAMEQGFQVAFMAPTELLARQHANTIYKLLEPLGFADQLSLLVGSLQPKQKQEAYERIKNGEVRLIVGTHALIQDKVDMHRLSLVIIDEQHRFGVEQRKKLLAKAGHMPHFLSLSATPIPRSLALTLYGELDISVIDAKPSNRRPIETALVLPSSRLEVYKKVIEQLASGRQAFVVTPLISENSVSDTVSAEKTYKELCNGPFKQWRVGLLHGRMKPDDKQKTMDQFLKHELDVLVATTVIEVGVDVPNATGMLIEDAERFGLAQIHQLRGRVGRSEHQGYCYLMLKETGKPSRRLQAVASSADGFELAELDLDLRGPGAIYGTQQHGLLDLRVAKLSDTKLIAQARQAAQAFIDKQENLLKYKRLSHRIQELRAVTNLN